ncbi:3-hydroxyacyl-CoA dehydrogenase NAD-binding domain-containing protein [Taibaiella soli]|uniref:3-hydroxyacyl-CoA dehydrogenase NAD-binding domain-containing protein n=1 Tax=Taibaiella soli TaxID=1649169 RepID=UPI001A9DF61A|nr:3-hydroxyacyl-CoA dehydrogenase NAD-binding domain-containing protein [Taibaiella soli]
MLQNNIVVGVVGSGAMGAGIAQVAAMAGHSVVLFDSNAAALEKAKNNLTATLNKLQEKGKINNATEIIGRFSFAAEMGAFKDCGLIIEAIVERLDVKKAVFSELEKIVNADCVLATNTSSLSVTSIAAACTKADRVMGLHFFNPAPLMALVEIIPAVQTEPSLIPLAKELMLKWGKAPVITKDTPGFIVNRVARPFYGEAIRIYEEGIADIATIDWALTELGGFRMGPFTLTDYIGHDVNYVVTETVFSSFFFDPRYKPSFSQKRLLEAGWLGRKTGRGFYNYAEGAVMPEPNKDTALGQQIVDRVVAMLINEAVEALHLNIASAADLELAMTKGVNYPKGLLQWCDELGAEEVLDTLDQLYNDYHEDRYRASVLLRKAVNEKKKFI